MAPSLQGSAAPQEHAAAHQQVGQQHAVDDEVLPSGGDVAGDSDSSSPIPNPPNAAAPGERKPPRIAPTNPFVL